MRWYPVKGDLALDTFRSSDSNKFDSLNTRTMEVLIEEAKKEDVEGLWHLKT
jgi:hypothetical protein